MPLAAVSASAFAQHLEEYMNRNYRRGGAVRLRYLDDDFDDGGIGSLSSSGRGFGRTGQTRGGSLQRGDEGYGAVRVSRENMGRYGAGREDSGHYRGPHDWNDVYAMPPRRYEGSVDDFEDERTAQPRVRRERRERIYPKGYTRSDERIREDICEALGDSGLDVSEVSVNVKDGLVTLEGTVKQRGIKHAIEDYADDCGGVKEIHNQIRVLRPSV